MTDFKEVIVTGIPEKLPPVKHLDPETNHAPARKDILSRSEKVLAVKNALRYFKPEHHPMLAPEFAAELKEFGRIYMYRFRPDYKMYARPWDQYPFQIPEAAAIMMMIQNNLDPDVAQHPHELITYGGNGAVFQNWAFVPFRWVSCSADPRDLAITDDLATEVPGRLAKMAGPEIQQQLQDNITWIKGAGQNDLLVGSQARILYANAEGRVEVARAFNTANNEERIGPIVLGRDHHDVSGTDSPYRETGNIYDGSRFTADMALHNVIGDSFRGATWVSLDNGGGVGWGEVIN